MIELKLKILIHYQCHTVTCHDVLDFLDIHEDILVTDHIDRDSIVIADHIEGINMAYGSSRVYSKHSGNTYRPTDVAGFRDSYGLKGGSYRRHDYNAEGAATLALDSYFAVNLLRFERAALTPTASNNYQTPSVENGSAISDFRASIKIKTEAALPVLIDVYEIQTSFFDVLTWNTVQPTNCPVTFSVVALAEGEIDQKAMVSTLIDSNAIANFRFVQHYIKHKGTLEFGTSASDQNVQELIMDSIPPKCVRSNLGMSWTLYFKFATLKNNAALTFPYKFALENSFIEQAIPTGDQLPYLY